jgi:FPC/CPF motif-containing protein YcgG
MTSDWALVSHEMQVSVSREALIRARQLISAQAGMLADQMDLGVVPALDGPDALRLLAMILAEEAQAPRMQ